MICKLCNSETDKLNHKIKHFVLSFIKEQHPDWVEKDGSCKKCLNYYENLDKVVEVVSQDSKSQD